MIAKLYIHTKTFFLLSFWLLTCGFSNSAVASECKESVARAVSIQGQVEVRSAGTAQWMAVQQEDEFCPGDRLRVSANSRAGLYLKNDSFLRLDEQSSVNFHAPAEDDSTWLDLLEGVAHFISRVRHSFQVNTPYVNASIEGTEFVVTSNTDQASVSVIEGRVKAENSLGEVVLGAGESVVAVQGNAPSKVLTITPGDAVKWALYYPLVIDPYHTADAASVESIRQAQTLYTDGDLVAALKNLDDLPVAARNVDLLLYRAALLLSVGRVDEASKDIQEALSQSHSDGRGLALQSIIALVGDDKEEAFRLAQQATQQSDQTSASYAALSYAQQADFDLDSALSSARRAVELAPRDALSRARVAELELAKGELRSAIESASMAVNLNPKLSRTHSVEGFAHLTQFNIAHAHAAFELAIALDQSDPLPRLGLGLAKIRKGRLEEGRHDIEIAASLDPNSSIIRSYLGKAYSEENREPLAASQLDMAKKLDPNDPTPWYYDALRKQIVNRPVEALEDMQTSIELNDNRAVYRSSFHLDQDEAARNASQARIYQDLGFDQLALTEGYKSLQTSPQSHSAHRLLSDSYTGLPRYESARLSELLQSQLLQPLNTTPIQPQLAASNLGILDGAGPSSGGFSEYTPLFTRNGLNVQLNAIAGSNDTRGNDLVISGLHDAISFSFGQFHYETDGWRDNNDLEQNI